MGLKVKTGKETFMCLTNLVKSGRELLPTKLPTLRDVLKYRLLLKEQSIQDSRKYPVSSLAKDIYPKALEQREKAN